MVSLNPNPCQAVAIIISGTWGSGSCSESSFVGFGGGVAVEVVVLIPVSWLG